MSCNHILEFCDIDKSFPGVKALDKVSFSVKRNSVHALVGENGAGKSTLMKILNGVYSADNGSIKIDDQVVQINSSLEAKSNGIGMVYQELNVVSELTIGENIFLGQEPLTKLGTINHKQLYKLTEEFLREQELDFDSKQKMKTLSLGEQQMIEIIKTVYFNSKIIVLDEPTSSLTDAEVHKLKSKIEDLKDSGATIIYISHRLEEIFDICEFITILRDGKSIKTCKLDELNKDQIISMMVGRSIEDVYPKKTNDLKEICLETKNLSNQNIKDVSISVRKGEIVGLAGLVGAGRTELARAVFGLDQVQSGEILINHQPVRINNPREAINYGIAMVPEDRRKYGLVTVLNIMNNIILPNYRDYSKHGLIYLNKMKTKSNDVIELLDIKPPNYKTITNTLSGGNQQKVVIGKWLISEPKILILDEPTRGIDVGVKTEIYKNMCDLAKKGMAILMISSELPEVLGMADRIYVMNNGEITGEVCKKDASQELVMKYAMTAN